MLNREEEGELAIEIGFEPDVIELCRQYSNKVRQLWGFDEDLEDMVYDGLCLDVPPEKVPEVITALRTQLSDRGYLVWHSEKNYGHEDRPDEIGVLKSDDKLDILEIKQTNGVNHDYENEHIVLKLREWDELFGITIEGAGHDWVTLRFQTLPHDLLAFCEEVYEFSPDAVDEGPGSVEKLVEELEATSTLSLWWE